MYKEEAAAIIKKSGQRITAQRLTLLNFLMSNKKAHSQAEIEEKIGSLMDRVTVYRSLSTFVAAKIISKLHDSNGKTTYIFNNQAHNRQAVHPHLKCKQCDTVECLPSLPEDYIAELSEKYRIENMEILFEGICQNCINTFETNQ